MSRIYSWFTLMIVIKPKSSDGQPRQLNRPCISRFKHGFGHEMAGSCRYIGQNHSMLRKWYEAREHSYNRGIET